jgi:hypothetical protein
MELIGKLLSSDVVLMALLASLALWGMALFVLWQERKKKEKTV